MSPWGFHIPYYECIIIDFSAKGLENTIHPINLIKIYIGINMDRFEQPTVRK